jgi:hypothetical protein
MMSHLPDNDLSSDHGVDSSLSGSSGSGWNQTFRNPAGHSFSPQQSAQQVRVSSRPLQPSVTTPRRGGCCLFNLGCIVLFLVFLLPFGFGILGAVFEDEDLREQVSDLVSDAVCPTRTSLQFDSTPRNDFFDELQTVRVECVTASGRVSADLTDEARNLVSLAAVVIGGYVVLLFVNTLMRGIGTAVATATGSLSTAERGTFAELSSGAPGSLGASPVRGSGRTSGTWVMAQDDPRYIAPTSLLEKRDRAAKQLDDLKEAYRRGGMSIEEYDRRRKQILEQL